MADGRLAGELQHRGVAVSYGLARTQGHVDACVNHCAMLTAHGSTMHPDRTFEQGVKAALEWVTGRSPHHPLEGE